jgi:hypothetical protein
MAVYTKAHRVTRTTGTHNNNDGGGGGGGGDNKIGSGVSEAAAFPCFDAARWVHFFCLIASYFFIHFTVCSLAFAIEHSLIFFCIALNFLVPLPGGFTFIFTRFYRSLLALHLQPTTPFCFPF